MREAIAISHLASCHTPELQQILALRPFLSFTKTELKLYCRANDVPWMEDPTNQDQTYLRAFNRSRLGAIAALSRTLVQPNGKLLQVSSAKQCGLG